MYMYMHVYIHVHNIHVHVHGYSTPHKIQYVRYSWRRFKFGELVVLFATNIKPFD